MKNLIVANWKMNPRTYAEADRLARTVSSAARSVKGVETVICPPFVWLECLAGDYGDRVAFGGQDAFWEARGAYTGEVSPEMLKSLGARYVIIGHSERRRHFGETDEMINKKVRAALRAGLSVILCVGETLAEHRRGHTAAVIRGQLRKDLAGVPSGRRQGLAIAYEPVWAIGTGLPETPENASGVAVFIRKELRAKIMILYGGSVNSKNIGGYLSMPEIDGALVGGASLDVADFSKILKIAGSA